MRKLDPTDLYDLDPQRPDLTGVCLVQALAIGLDLATD